MAKYKFEDTKDGNDYTSAIILETDEEGNPTKVLERGGTEEIPDHLVGELSKNVVLTKQSGGSDSAENK